MERYQEVGVEAYTYFLAGATNNSRFILPHHQTPDERLDPLGVVLFTLSAHLFIRLDIVANLKGLLFLHQVKVLLNSIDQIADELLRVLLPVP